MVRRPCPDRPRRTGHRGAAEPRDEPAPRGRHVAAALRHHGHNVLPIPSAHNQLTRAVPVAVTQNRRRGLRYFWHQSLAETSGRASAPLAAGCPQAPHLPAGRAPDPIRNREAPGPGRACPFGGKAWHGTEPLSVVFFQDSGKFTYRYSTLGFQDEANLDDGDMWPVSYCAHEVEPRGGEEDCRAGEGRDPLIDAAAGSRAERRTEFRRCPNTVW